MMVPITTVPVPIRTCLLKISSLRKVPYSKADLYIIEELEKIQEES